MNTCFVLSPDGTRIAYDVNGTGPAIMLLHGGGSFRQEWHAAGYVERLKNEFTMITVDLRGHGESDQPENPPWYTPEKMSRDFLAVADACAVDHFTLWGFSYGGKAGRYLAVRSARVDKIILNSTPFGPAIPGKTNQDIFDFCAHWSPIVQAQRDGTLDIAPPSPWKTSSSCANATSRRCWAGCRPCWIGHQLNRPIFAARRCGCSGQKIKRQCLRLKRTKIA